MAIDILRGKDGRKDIHLWTPVHEVESSALDQLKNVAALPWVFHHVAVMADVHYGKGATVGSVIAMKDAVSPAAVGVDIGCGMGAIKTTLTASDLPDNLDELRSLIEAAIPVGFNSHDEPAFKGGMPEVIKREGQELFSEFRNLAKPISGNYYHNHDGKKVPVSFLGKAKRQVGTLGGGNHFIELCLDDGVCSTCHGSGESEGHSNLTGCIECHGHPQKESRVWMVLHSGSRNIGKVLAEHHIEIARKLAHNRSLPDRDLAVFLAGTQEMKDYRNDLMWAQRYAFFNRKVMFELYRDVIGSYFMAKGGDGFFIHYETPILCHHNFVSEEVHFNENLIITRKGAISARAGEMGIIPGSMGTKSYVVRGLGNEESFQSASHGAGRRMSRGKAKKEFTLEDLKKQTEGVCCRKDHGVLDEIPGAYKSIEQVMENQKDLVEVVATLKQVLCIKG